MTQTKPSTAQSAAPGPTDTELLEELTAAIVQRLRAGDPPTAIARTAKLPLRIVQGIERSMKEVDEAVLHRGGVGAPAA